MNRATLRGFLFCLTMTAVSGILPRVSSAQSFVLDLPLGSQHAEVSQRIGITDVTIDYHRPLVNDRKIWGAWFRTVRYGALERMKTPRSRSAIPF
jgi:hypothetical protein